VRETGFIGMVMDRLPFEKPEVRYDMMLFVCNYAGELRTEREVDHLL